MTRRRAVALAAVFVFGIAIVATAVVAGGGGGSGNGKARQAELAKLARPQTSADTKSGAPEAALAPAFAIDYVVKGTLPTLPPTAPAYRVSKAVTKADVAALAAKLGLKGEVTDDSGGYSVTDGNHQLTVPGMSSIAIWTYSDQPASGGAGGVASSGSAVAAPACPQKPCPPGMACAAVCGGAPVDPKTFEAHRADRAEAEKAGRDFLARVGVDLTKAHINVNDGITEWTIIADPEVGGLPTTGLSTTVTVGPKGVILNAAGLLGTPDKLGDYPLVGVDAGLERLKSGKWWFGGPRPLGGVEAQLGAPAQASAGKSGGGVPTPDQPPAPNAVPPAPPPSASGSDQPQPEPTPVPDPMPRRTVTITGAHLGLVLVDNMLEPAYIFETGDTGIAPTVPAVQDKFLAP